jgi:hypothetical protein
MQFFKAGRGYRGCQMPCYQEGTFERGEAAGERNHIY